MTAEHERLMARLSPLRERGWVLLPTTLAAPTERRIVDAVFGLRTHGKLEDNIQAWDVWAIASRLHKPDRRHEVQTWHRAGRLEDVLEELLHLPD